MIPYSFGQPANGNDNDRDHATHHLRNKLEKKDLSVLIVEDELLVAENLREFVQSQGYKVIEVVSSAETAVEQFPSLDPDLVIMDVRLEGRLDGIEAAVIIHQTLKKVPILFLTAYTKEDFPQLLSLDPALFRFVSKPYEPKEFSAILKKLLPTH